MGQKRLWHQRGQRYPVATAVPVPGQSGRADAWEGVTLSHPASNQSHILHTHTTGWETLCSHNPQDPREMQAAQPQLCLETTVPEKHGGGQQRSQIAQELNRPEHGGFPSPWLSWETLLSHDSTCQLNGAMFCACSDAAGHLPHGIFFCLDGH